jgi:dUTP pyrophosphatase
MSVIVHNSSPWPLKRATDGASGYDLHAATSREEIHVQPGQRWKVPTGIHLAMPDTMEAQVRGRSGLALNHGVVAAPGTIDSDYRGEICVILLNLGRDVFVVRQGDRIAQLVFAPVVHPNFEAAPAAGDLPVSMRGAGGFGSSGTAPLVGG